jgi:hypothetical protein
MRIPRRTASEIERERMAEDFWADALDTAPRSHAAAADKLALQLYAEMHPQEMAPIPASPTELENHGGEDLVHPSAASDASLETELWALPPRRSNAVAGLWWGRRHEVTSPLSVNQSTAHVSSEGSNSRSSSGAGSSVDMPMFVPPVIAVDARSTAASSVTTSDARHAVSSSAAAAVRRHLVQLDDEDDEDEDEDEDDLVVTGARIVSPPPPPAPASRHLPQFMTKKNRRKNTTPAAAAAERPTLTDEEIALRQVISDELRAAAAAQYDREQAAIEAAEEKAMEASRKRWRKERQKITAEEEFAKFDLQGLQFMKPLKFKPEHVRLQEDYIIMRKVDGNRAKWDGLRRILYSKSGYKAEPPSFWAAQMPQGLVYLDGELYREDPHAGSAIYKTDLNNVSAAWTRKWSNLREMREREQRAFWSGLKYMAFDVLNPATLAKPLEERLAVLDKLKPQQNNVFHVMPYEVIRGNVYFTQESYAYVLQTYCEQKKAEWGDALGAEGLVLKQASSHYESFKSYTLKWLKYKFYEDIEGLIASVPKLKPGEARYYVHVKLPMGQRIIVSAANGNLFEKGQLKVGTIVHLQYMSGTDLREAVIRGILADGTTWDMIVNEYRKKHAAIKAPASSAAAAAAARPSSAITALAVAGDENMREWINLLGH